MGEPIHPFQQNPDQPLFPRPIGVSSEDLDKLGGYAPVPGAPVLVKETIEIEELVEPDEVLEGSEEVPEGSGGEQPPATEGEPESVADGAGETQSDEGQASTGDVSPETAVATQTSEEPVVVSEEPVVEEPVVEPEPETVPESPSEVQEANPGS